MDKKDPLSEGVTILLVSAGAYLGAYLYERSYVGAFGVPMEFIEVSVSTMVTIGGGILGISMLIAQCLDLLRDFDKLGLFSEKNGYGWFIRRWGLFIILIGIAVVIYQPRWYSMIPALLWISLMIADLAIPFFQKDKQQPYKVRLAEWLKGRSDSPDGEPTLFKSQGLERFRTIVVLIALFTFLCSFSGSIAAKTTRNFGFIDGFDENVIIRRYGDRYVLAKYNWETTTFERSFRIVNADQIEGRITSQLIPSWIIRVEELSEPSSKTKKP